MKAIILLNQVKQILMDMFMLRILKLEIIKLFWRYKMSEVTATVSSSEGKETKTEINICHCDTDLKYKDLLSEGEMCCIAIPGYLYKGSAQSCFSVVNNIIKTQVILTDSITISVYAQLVEDLFVLRFGKKPQDFTGSQIEYFIPAQQIVVSQAAINAGDVKENKVEAPSKS